MVNGIELVSWFVGHSCFFVFFVFIQDYDVFLSLFVFVPNSFRSVNDRSVQLLLQSRWNARLCLLQFGAELTDNLTRSHFFHSVNDNRTSDFNRRRMKGDMMALSCSVYSLLSFSSHCDSCLNHLWLEENRDGKRKFRRLQSSSKLFWSKNSQLEFDAKRGNSLEGEIQWAASDIWPWCHWVLCTSWIVNSLCSVPRRESNMWSPVSSGSFDRTSERRCCKSWESREEGCADWVSSSETLFHSAIHNNTTLSVLRTSHWILWSSWSELLQLWLKQFSELETHLKQEPETSIRTNGSASQTYNDQVRTDFVQSLK